MISCSLFTFAVWEVSNKHCLLPFYHFQYLVLKLEKLAMKLTIIENITFGKYEKTHICNITIGLT